MCILLVNYKSTFQVDSYKAAKVSVKMVIFMEISKLTYFMLAYYVYMHTLEYTGISSLLVPMANTVAIIRE